MRLAPFILLLYASVSGLAAQTVPSSPDRADAPTTRAAQLNGSIRVDGVLDEPQWRDSLTITRFIQSDPVEGADPTEQTEVRILVGRDALYVGARMFDRQPNEIRRRLARRDEPPQADYFALFLDSRHDHVSAYAFGVTPSGSVADLLIRPDGDQDVSWDAIWDVRTNIDDVGWTAEFRIPLSQIRYTAGQDSWGIQLERFIFRKAERDVFAFTPKSQQAGVNRYGHLTGLREVSQPRHLELIPYVTGRSESRHEPEGSPFGGDQMTGSAGLDARYSLTSNFTLSATINPDFGQVEVDPAVLNLTAFETFFPEKRPFFVEGAEVFDFGRLRAFNTFSFATPLHSRRIGRTPQRSVGGRGFKFVEAPEETTIAGALKLTGRTAGGWTVGVLDAATTDEKARFVNDEDVRDTTAVEPVTNFFVGRVRRDMQDGAASVGALFTSVDRKLDNDALASLLRSSARVLGVDGGYSWADRAWTFDTLLIVSDMEGTSESIARAQRSSTHYFQRPDATHVKFDPRRTELRGHAFEAALARQAGSHWTGSVAYQERSPGFELNDLGFLRRSDFRALSSFLQYSEQQPGTRWRSYAASVYSTQVRNFGDETIRSNHNVRIRGLLTNYWGLGAWLSWSPSVLDDELTRGGPIARRPASRAIGFNFGSDSRRSVTVGGNGTYASDSAGGWERGFAIGLDYRPQPALQVRVGPSISRSRSAAQYITTIDDESDASTFGRRYIFSDLDHTVVALQARVDWTFTPRLSLQVFAQPFISSGAFGKPAELRAPRTFTFDVYGRDHGTISYDPVDRAYRIDPDGTGTASSFEIADPDFSMRSLRGNAVLRWEWRPGSTLFLVWQQRRQGFDIAGDFDLRSDSAALFRDRPENIVLLKASYWIGR